jgi:PEP-CTERM motif
MDRDRRHGDGVRSNVRDRLKTYRGLRVLADQTAAIDAKVGKVFLKGLTQTSAVPEPATWSMILFGVALVGSTLRRRVATRASAPA